MIIYLELSKILKDKKELYDNTHFINLVNQKKIMDLKSLIGFKVIKLKSFENNEISLLLSNDINVEIIFFDVLTFDYTLQVEQIINFIDDSFIGFMNLHKIRYLNLNEKDYIQICLKANNSNEFIICCKYYKIILLEW